MANNAPKHIQDSFNAIIGNPPRILIPNDYDPNCLYQAFVGAVSIFEAGEQTPASYLTVAYKTLKDRVKISKQPNAQSCLEAFNLHYRDKLKTFVPTAELEHQQEVMNAIDLLIDDTKAAIAKWQEYPTAINRQEAMQYYDSLIDFAVTEDTDEAHDKLEDFQEEFEADITNLLQASKQDRRPQGISAPQPRPPGRK